MPKPRALRVRSACLLLFGVAACALDWSPTFRDAVAGTAIQQEPVPSNIISIEPARPATVTETGTPPTPPAHALPEPPPQATTTLPAPHPVPIIPESTAQAASAPRDPAPDEAALWELLHAERYGDVLTETARLRTAYPAWQPPHELVSLARSGIAQAGIRKAMAANDHGKLIQMARQSPTLFSCAHLDQAWSLADAYATLGPRDGLFGLLAGLINACRERDRLATLQKAVTWLAPDDWERLADLEAANPRTPGVDAEFLRVRYDQDISRLLAAKNAVDPGEFFQRFDRISARVESYQDANIALLAGWSFLDAKDTGTAAHWFGRARDWRPADADAARGLALCALAERRHADARLLAEGIPAGEQGREEILRNAAVGMAQAAYEQEDFASALQLLTDAGPRTGLPRYAQLMTAWSLLHLGKSAQALEIFQEVHRQQADAESAQGTFYALISSTDAGALEQYPADELLAPLLQRYHADQSFFRKRFLAARDRAPDVYGANGGAGTPRAAWYGMLRDKSGSTGLSKLEDTVNSLEGVWPLSGRSEITFRLDHHQLDSGAFAHEARLSLAGDLLTGALGITSDSPGFTDLAETGAASLRVSGAGADVSIWEPHLTWRSETRFEVEADIGLSAVGGVLDPRVIGQLSVRDSNKWGNFGITGYAKPIRESILSYTGWRLDEFLPASPLNGEKWGAVRAAGTELSGYVPLGNGFGFNGKIGLEQIDAKNVRENSHAFLLAGLNHGLELDGFDYFAAGISAGYDHYRHNLSHFTPGHGGYFSPQTFWQYKANLDFLTLENRQAVVKGHVDGGRVLKREGATPIIPLDGFSGQGFYPGNREWGWAYTVELNGAIRVGNHVQVGALVSRRESPQYDETAGMLFIRVLFEPRNSVLSSDLPGRVMDSVR